MMTSLVSNEMTREQKEEFATKKMNEMRLKNQLMKQRYEEVEKDRLEAEKQCAAVTATRTKTKPLNANKYEEVDIPRSQPSHKPEREWDIGKGSEGDWSTEKVHDFHSYRNSRTRGSTDNGNFKRDFNWKPHDDFNKKDNSYQSYSNKQSGSFRGNPRYQGPNRGRPTNSHYDNSRQYSKSGPPRNWNEDSRKNFSRGSSQSNFNNQNNSYSKVQPRYNDKIWQGESLNEAQNKHLSVEKWVKSISSVESWTESEDKNLSDKTEQESNSTKPYYVGHKGEGFTQKNSHLEERSHRGEFHKSNYHQIDHSNIKTAVEKKSFIDRQTEMHMHGRLKHKETQRHKDVEENKPYGHIDKSKSRKYSDTRGGKESGYQKNITSGNWSDDDDCYDPKSKQTGRKDDQGGKARCNRQHSGTWSDDGGNKKDSESWTDIDDSCENGTPPSHHQNPTFKQGTKPRSFADRKDNKYSNAWNSERPDSRRTETIHNSWTERKTFNRSKSNSETYNEDSVDRKDARNIGNRGGFKNNRDGTSHFSNHSTKFNTYQKSQGDDKKHSKPSKSWGVEKSEKHIKISGAWSDIEDESCDNKDASIIKALKYDNAPNKAGKHDKTSGAWSDVEDESNDKDISTNRVSKYHCASGKSDEHIKTGGTWSDVEEDSGANKCVSTGRDTKSAKNEQALGNSYANTGLNKSKSFSAKSSGSPNKKNSQKHESGVWSDQEFDNHTEDYSDGISSSWNTLGGKCDKNLVRNKICSSGMIAQNNLENEVSNLPTNASHEKGFNKNESDLPFNNAVDIKNDTKECNSINVSEILQQSVSEDSTFTEHCSFENNDSPIFEDLKGEKICAAIEDAALNSSSLVKTRNEVENVSDLP